jgi:pyrroloquinoline quinone (PQQ) biosynthesis protein C/mannose-6-phosphate isomerase-like protein (cupin superfamily)
MGMEYARGDAAETIVRRSGLPGPRTTRTPLIIQAIEELHAQQARHRFWDNGLLRACEDGTLGREDFRYIFGQYYLYSKNFTRYLAGLMARCESDYFRARLAENLWEEGGGCNPEKRHSQLFRNFLQGALGINNPDATEFADETRCFVDAYLEASFEPDPLTASAFLAFGTEGIVARLYTILLDGLRRAGVSDEHLEFFRLHIECDDAHALTLEDMVASYSSEPRWFESCLQAMDRALTLRAEFFESLYQTLCRRRLDFLLERVQGRRSLAAVVPSDASLVHRVSEPALGLYENEISRLDIQFTVDRLPFPGEVLDPRIGRIPPGKSNERHRHAHETVIYFIEGSGRVTIDDRELPAAAGDALFIPRWAMHQTRNTGEAPLVYLAVTDFHFTRRAFMSDAERMKQPTPIRSGNSHSGE